MVDMNAHLSVQRGIAAVSSGALVVGAGAAVGVLSAHMADEWSAQAALESAASMVVDPTADLSVPRPVVVTRTKVRRITPDPVVVHKKVFVRVPAGQAVPAQSWSGSAPAPRSTSTSSSTTTSRPSRTVVAPAPQPAAPAPQAPSGGTTSKTS
jgi:hypothetical protein